MSEIRLYRWFRFSVSSCSGDSRLAPSQWETSLQSNAVSHWLGANLDSTLKLSWMMTGMTSMPCSLQWRHMELGGVSDHQPHECLLDRLIRRRLKKTSKLRVTGLCAGNSPVIGELPAHRASNVKNVSIWWPHHVQTPNTPKCDFKIPVKNIHLIKTWYSMICDWNTNPTNILIRGYSVSGHTSVFIHFHRSQMLRDVP